MMQKKHLMNGSAEPNTLWTNFSWPPFIFLGTGVLASAIGVALGLFGIYGLAAVIFIVGMYLTIVLRLDELATMVTIAVHLYADWYLGLRVVGLLMTLILLLLLLLVRSPRYHRIGPPALWLWVLLLVLALFPSISGTLGLYDTLFYYPNIFLGAFITFWLGTVIAHNPAGIHRLFKWLAAFAALLAIHTIIEFKTGIILFASSTAATHYGNALFYHDILGGSEVYRVASFFIDPNWNGTFFALIFFIPLGLFAESTVLWEKVVSLIEATLILLALFATFSVGAWIACIAGGIFFILFIGRIGYRIAIPLFIAALVVVIAVLLPSQVNYLLHHASNPAELSLRKGAWHTALRVIQAFPLTGVGLGILGYAQRVEFYRVPEQFVPLAHPHNSYLELGAMAGLPVLITFVVLILFPLWLAILNWAKVDIRLRPLLAGGLATVIVLSVNSVTINAWTLPPLAAIGWLILGAISSPLLTKTSVAKK